MMTELGLATDARTIAAHYRGLIDGLVIDERDSEMADRLDLPVAVAQTLMLSVADREALAQAVLAFAARLAAPIRKASGGYG